MHHTSLFPPLPKLPPRNIHHLLFNRPDQADWPDYTLHVDALTGETRSFKQFLEIVRDGATAMSCEPSLGGLGIRPKNDELIGILTENSMDCLALIHSALVMTVPFVMFSSYSTPYEFQQLFKLVGPTRLFASPSLLPLGAASGLSDDRIYVLGGNVEGRISYGDLVARARTNKLPRLPVQEAREDTLAYLIFSSGTSGLPKAVMTSHGNLTVSTLQLMVMLAEATKVQAPTPWRSPSGRNVVFNALPMHHTYGLHVTAFTRFFLPGTLVLLSKWNIDVFFNSITKYHVTSIYLVPSLVHQVVHHPRSVATDFSNVQSITCGAAHLPVSLSDKLLSLFPGADRVSGGYAMSECSISVSMQPPPGLLGGRAKNVPGSVGILMPGIEARVVREDGSLAGVNEPGELHIRAGNVALGYWNNPKATGETFRDGWLCTGDRMRIDADGVLYFEDRAKDTLKISGMQVSPVEIEETLLRHPGKLIIDASVAGVSGGRTADELVPRAWIVLSNAGETLGAAEVAARLEGWVKERLSRYKWLRGGIAVVRQIPKSPTGKVLRRVLVDEHEAKLRTRGARL